MGFARALLGGLALLLLILVVWLNRLPVPSRPPAAEEPDAVVPGMRGGFRRHFIGVTAARTAYRSSWAVIVGINAYPGGRSGLAPLDHAVNDARELRDLLQGEFGYAPERTRYLADAGATRAAVRDAFSRWLPEQD